MYKAVISPLQPEGGLQRDSDVGRISDVLLDYYLIFKMGQRNLRDEVSSF
jgi:hypothetical protein